MKDDSVESVLKDKKNINIEDRKIFVKKSQSVTKIRENLKNVLFISNLPFATNEEKLKDFLEKENITNLIDVLIVRDESGKSKGFGFVELGDEVLFTFFNLKKLGKYGKSTKFKRSYD